MAVEQGKKGISSIEAAGMTGDMQVRSWLPLYFFIGLALGSIGYLLFGSIPLTAQGNAIFLTSEAVIPFQSKAGGLIGKWYVKVGDHVHKGQLLGMIQQPVIEKELEQAKDKFENIKENNRTITSYTRIYIDLERGVTARRKSMLTERIKALKNEIARSRQALESTRTGKMKYAEQRERDLHEIVRMNEKRTRELEEKLDLVHKMKAKGLRSQDEVVRAEQEITNQKNSHAGFNLQLFQSGQQKVKEEELYLNDLNRIAEQEDSVSELELELGELLKSEAQLAEQYASGRYGMKLEAGDLGRDIDRFSKELADNSMIISDHDGRILELTAGEGRVVNKGQMLGTIETGEPRKKGLQAKEKLQAVAYFRLDDGKKIKPGMTLRLTPATVERARFGSLIAKVRSVSGFPVTKEGAAKVTGNSSVAELLTKNAHQIEVFADLVGDETTFSGYKWDTTGGPESKVTSGTVASALADLEQRPPVSMVIPILRDWAGFGGRSRSGQGKPL